MEISFLDEITQVDEVIFTWRNGKTGALCDKRANGEIRFFEYDTGKNGVIQLNQVFHEPIANFPLVCAGIGAYWIFHRKDSGVIRQKYDDYTKRLFEKFKYRFRNDANTWKWKDADWKRLFYANLIQQEKYRNELSEPVFDFITESDARWLRPVMDNYIVYLEECIENCQQEQRGKLTGVLDTNLARKIFAKCIEKGWMHETESGYKWDGIPGCRGKTAMLAYLCGKIYGFKYDKISGNSGNAFPEKELNRLFNEQYLEKQLLQVYGAKRKQKWRTIIDELFD